mmetsp:Transcript_45751/g.141546  ORF Transcript_45751/g.141546 Transcript_45751/m.141546 type:complete len:258 (-) Transcript_45751:50-823(-)
MTRRRPGRPSAAGEAGLPARPRGGARRPSRGGAGAAAAAPAGAARRRRRHWTYWQCSSGRSCPPQPWARKAPPGRWLVPQRLQARSAACWRQTGRMRPQSRRRCGRRCSIPLWRRGARTTARPATWRLAAGRSARPAVPRAACRRPPLPSRPACGGARGGRRPPRRRACRWRCSRPRCPSSRPWRPSPRPCPCGPGSRRGWPSSRPRRRRRGRPGGGSWTRQAGQGTVEAGPGMAGMNALRARRRLVCAHVRPRVQS